MPFRIKEKASMGYERPLYLVRRSSGGGRAAHEGMAATKGHCEMSQQPELKMFEAAPDDKNVHWLENLLLGAQCWMTAKDILLTVNGKLLDRDLRALASASKWIISGQKGYRHVKHSSPEEVAHAANWLVAQAKKMSDRAGRIRRAAHEVFG